MQKGRKAIPEARDRAQSRALVWAAGLVLGGFCLPVIVLMTQPHHGGSYAVRAGLVSLTFGVVVWVLRAATPPAAFCGAMICLLVTFHTEAHGGMPEIHSGLVPLMGLFVLTFLATKAGKSRKVKAGLAESRKGRNAAQVIANLGAAGLVAALAAGSGNAVGFAALLGVLAEATADTVSSEIGQAFGGTPYLLTSMQRVEPGTDGAISLLGTAAGLCGAAIVVFVGVWSMALPLQQGIAAFGGGVAGLFFDSVLGATVERRGWLGNDLVNFTSTVFAGAVALGLAGLVTSAH